VETGKLWAKCESVGVEEQQVTAEFTSSKSLDKATLIYTTETGFTGDREWLAHEAELRQSGDKWIVTTKLPKESVGWFVNVNSGDLTVSSEYQGE